MLEVVFEHDRLAIEQKARVVCRRIVEQLIDQRHETLTKAFRGVIPLPVPVRVGDDVDGQHKIVVGMDNKFGGSLLPSRV